MNKVNNKNFIKNNLELSCYAGFVSQLEIHLLAVYFSTCGYKEININKYVCSLGNV